MIVAAMQPIVEIRSYRIIAKEMLVRWHDVDAGRYVTPMEHLRRHGKIDWTKADLGVLRWLGRIPSSDQPIHINLSPETMRCSLAFARWFQELTRVAGYHPAGIVVEVSERVAEEGMSLRDVIMQVVQMREAGVRVALDDVNGSPELLYWMEAVDWDVIKIDWRKYLRTKKNEHVSELLSRGRTRNIDMVLEGVETEADILSAHTLQARTIQGFACGRPIVPVVWAGDKVEAW